jgi:hypothetical protein
LLVPVWTHAVSPTKVEYKPNPNCANQIVISCYVQIVLTKLAITLHSTQITLTKLLYHVRCCKIKKIYHIR